MTYFTNLGHLLFMIGLVEENAAFDQRLNCLSLDLKLSVITTGYKMDIYVWAYMVNS